MKKRRNALVLASSSGLGFAVAKSLLKSGNNVILNSNSDRVFAAESLLMDCAYEGDILAIKGDVTKLDDLDMLIEKSKERFGHIDIVFTNCKGPKPGVFNDLNIHDYLKAHNDIVLPVIYIAQKLIPDMLDNNWGRIIINTSITAKEPAINLVLSNIYRSALVSLSKTLAKQLASHNITVNAIGPAAFKTERALEILNNMAKKANCTIDEIEKSNTTALPMKRYNTPDEFANTVSFIASDHSSAITGSFIAVDGGISNSIF